MARPGLGLPAQVRRLDRTKPRICSPAELVPSRALLERNFKQSSASASGGPHLLGKCGIPSLRDSPRSPRPGLHNPSGERTGAGNEG